MAKQHNITAKTYHVNLMDLDLSGPEAKNLLLTLVNNRIDYHNRESFSTTVCNGKSSVDHLGAIHLLQQAKQALNGIIFQAREGGNRIKVSGNIVINLLDEHNCKKVV